MRNGQNHPVRQHPDHLRYDAREIGIAAAEVGAAVEIVLKERDRRHVARIDGEVGVCVAKPPRLPFTETLQRLIQSAPYTTNTGDSWLKFGTFKLTLDGGMTIGTAYQRHPYGAFGKQLYGMTNPDDRGQLFIPPAKLLAVMRAARNRAPTS